jgi:hypothetical protein
VEAAAKVAAAVKAVVNKVAAAKAARKLAVAVAAVVGKAVAAVVQVAAIDKTGKGRARSDRPFKF